MNRQYEKNIYFSVQENAWCDQETFEEWIDFVWMPFVETKRPLPTLLILDQYKVHQQDKILEKLANLGTLVIHLPPGETSKLQVLDVGINKPFKDLKNKSHEEDR